MASWHPAEQPCISWLGMINPSQSHLPSPAAPRGPSIARSPCHGISARPWRYLVAFGRGSIDIDWYIDFILITWGYWPRNPATPPKGLKAGIPEVNGEGMSQTVTEPRRAGNGWKRRVLDSPCTAEWTCPNNLNMPSILFARMKSARYGDATSYMKSESLTEARVQLFCVVQPCLASYDN